MMITKTVNIQRDYNTDFHTSQLGYLFNYDDSILVVPDVKLTYFDTDYRS